MKVKKISILFFLCLALLLSVFPVAAAPVGGVTADSVLSPLNPKATPEAKSLLAYLSTVGESDRFVSGTFDISNDDEVYNGIKAQFGKETGLYSARYFVSAKDGFTYGGETYDIMDFYRVEETNARLKEHYENGNILLIHADKPEDALGDYAFGTLQICQNSNDLIVHLDETNPERNMDLYTAWVHYRTELIAALQALEDSGVKEYLFRPWVEMNTRSFTGTGEEGWAAFRRVFRQTVDAFRASDLRGYLIQFAPASAETSHTDVYYPGNDYVDGIAPTLYAYSDADGALSPKQMPDKDWYDRTGKPFGLSEISCRSGDWETMFREGRSGWYNTLTDMLAYYPRVSWVNAWGNGAYSLVNTTNGSPAEGNDDGYWFVAGDYSITLDKLADYRCDPVAAPGVVQIFTEKNYGGNTEEKFVSNYIGLAERTYTYSDLRAMGLDPARIAGFHINRGFALRCYASENATGTAWIYLSSTPDAAKLRSAGKIRSLQVFTTENMALDQPQIIGSDNDDEAWKANDGAYSCWEARTDAAGQGWLMLDMDEPYTVNRWVVRHAGSIGMPATYNTADYALQYSTDGENWKTADTVTGNDCGQTDRILPSLATAQYFRLLITRPNTVDGPDSDQIMVSEWELYGLPNPGEKKNGLVREADGWWYYEDGVRQTEGETLAEYNGSRWHIKNGRLVFDTTLVRCDGAWFYVKDGAVQENFNGFVKHADSGVWFYVTDGKINWTLEGAFKHPSGVWFMVKGGQIDWGYNGFYKVNGVWFYFENGQINWNLTGLFKHPSGTWFYVQNAQINWTYTGFGKHLASGTWFYCENGSIAWSKSGAFKHPSGVWFVVSGGQINWGFTGVYKANGALFYFRNGQLDFGFSGKVKYNGKTCTVRNGQVV